MSEDTPRSVKWTEPQPTTEKGRVGSEPVTVLLGKLLGRHHREMMLSGAHCAACHNFRPTINDVKEAAALLPEPTLSPRTNAYRQGFSDGEEWAERFLRSVGYTDAASRLRIMRREDARLSEPGPQVISGYVDPSGKGEGNWDEG